MADIDLKALTPGSAAASSVIVGAANTSAATPSLFTTTGSGNVVLTDGTLAVTTAKTLTVNNSLTLAGTDGSTLNVGAGGTLGALATATPGTGVATAATNAVNTTAGFITFATFAPASGKTLTLSNTLTLAGTDGTTMTFPSTSATLARTDAGNTFTSNQTFTGSIVLNGATSGTVTLGVPATAGTTTFTLPSSNGTNGFILTTNGSGVTSWTNPTSLGIDLDVGTTAISGGTVGRVLFEGAGNVLQESANLTFSSSALTLGVAGSATGSVVLAGGTSGTVTLQPAAAAGTGTIFQFPSSNGTANYALTTNGSGVSSWSQISLTAAVTGVLPVANGGTGLSSLSANRIPYGAGTSALANSDNFTWDGSSFNVKSASSFYPQATFSASVANANGGYLIMEKSRGASAVQVNDFLGSINFKGFDSGGVSRNAILSYATVTAVGASSVDAAYTFMAVGSTSYLDFGTNSTPKVRIDNPGNLLIGTTTSPTTGTQCLTIETGTAATASPADTITIYSTDLSAGNTMLSLYTEGTPVNANTTAATTHRIAIRVNGTVYYLLANTAA